MSDNRTAFETLAGRGKRRGPYMVYDSAVAELVSVGGLDRGLVEDSSATLQLARSEPRVRRRGTTLTAIAAGFVLVMAAVGIAGLVGRTSDGASNGDAAAITGAVVGTPADSVPGDGDTGVALGEPTRLPSPGQVMGVQSTDGVLYAAVVGSTDRIMESRDNGATWDVVLEADPPDSEGLFATGRLVIQVIEDDNPARDTVAPGSAVTDGLRVLVYDPASGDSWETELQRPADPEIDPLPLDEPAGNCALGGYQSWVHANAVAVGDRLMVAGSLSLVGRLADGTVICDGQVYSFFTWTSDDDGHTWDMHQSQQLSSVAWTGERFVAWSDAQDANGAPSQLLVSDDGIDWAMAVDTPIGPDGSMPVGTSIATSGERVVASTILHSWAVQVPDDVTTAEQLHDFLATTGIGEQLDIEGMLESIGVDFPLDEHDRAVISSFEGATIPIGAIVATSTNSGATWEATFVDEPITGAVVLRDGYVAVTSQFGDLTSEDDDHSQLLASTDGINWTSALELPELAYGPTRITATEDSIYLMGEQTGSLWRIPIP